MPPPVVSTAAGVCVAVALSTTCTIMAAASVLGGHPPESGTRPRSTSTPGRVICGLLHSHRAYPGPVCDRAGHPGERAAGRLFRGHAQPATLPGTRTIHPGIHVIHPGTCAVLHPERDRRSQYVPGGFAAHWRQAVAP